MTLSLIQRAIKRKIMFVPTSNGNLIHDNKAIIRIKVNIVDLCGNRDSSPTRQFADTHFEDSSPTELKTVHRQN